MNPNDLLTALGPLAPFFADESVTEIMVDGPDHVYLDRRGPGLEESDVRFPSPQAVQALIEGVLALDGNTLAPGQTLVDIGLPEARMAAVLPPNAPQGPCLVIRKLPARILTWEEVIGYRAITREAADFLQSAVQARANILVAGGTGSGKTTVLGLLASSLPAEERVIFVEEAREIRLNQPRPRAVWLEGGGPAGLSASDLLLTAAKLRPDRLVVGELRGAEALHALQLFSTGHDGSLASIHATSPEDALARLEALCLMANLGLGLGEIRNLIASALGLITVQRRLPDGSRKLTDIVELRGLQDDRYLLQPLFRYNPESKRLERLGVPATV